VVRALPAAAQAPAPARTGRYLLANQSQGRLAQLQGDQLGQGAAAEFLGEYMPKVNAVTAAQVREAGRKR
jgi:predicted Zn-dependent peptidase